MRRVLLGVYLLAAAVLAVWVVRGAVDRVAGRLDDESAAGVVPAAGAIERVVVRKGMGGDAIAELLESKGVVSDASRFRMLLGMSGASAELQAGCYELARGTPAMEVIRRLRNGITTGRALTIPEGLRAEEIAERGVDAGVGTSEEWQDALQRFAAAVGPPGRPPSAGLTGYLMPASYPIECDSTPETMLRAMIDAFAEQASPALVAEAQAQGLTPHEVVTIASIVEREAVVKEERPIIASVFRNRLDAGVSLDADPTVQYAVATAESVAAYGWWKQELTLDDLEVESPYNTYANAGLPPGPIASPGLDAILATLHPVPSDYLYFVARGDGTHAFAETLSEHNANVARYITGSAASGAPPGSQAQAP